MTGLSQQRLSQFLRQKVYNRTDTLEEANQKIILHLGALKGGHKSRGGLDLVHERARLSNAQTKRVNFDLRKLRGEFIPIRLLVEIWTRQNMTIKSKLLAIPNAIGSKLSKVEPAVISFVEDSIREALTELGSLPLPKEFADKFEAWVNDGTEPAAEKRQ